MTDSYEQERFYRRANTAVDVAEVALYWRLAKELLPPKDPSQPQLSAATKAWWWGMLGFIVLAPVTFMFSGATQSTEEAIRNDGHTNYVPAIICLVLAAVCFLVGCLCPPDEAPAPQAPRPTPARPTPPVGPAPTQTRVERSVRVVRAQATTTSHNNPPTPTAALESPHKDVEQSSGLVVVRQRRPTILWTEDHGTYRTVDKRSFDRDIGPV